MARGASGADRGGRGRGSGRGRGRGGRGGGGPSSSSHGGSFPGSGNVLGSSSGSSTPGGSVPSGAKAWYQPRDSPFAARGRGRGRGSTPTVFPAFHTSRGLNNSRAPEEQGDAKYLAGMSSGFVLGGKGSGARRFRSGDPADDKNPHFHPVSFVKASGEWKDGRWTGKQPEGSSSSSAPSQAEGSQQRYDAINARRAGTGLGYTPAAQPREGESSIDEGESEPVEDQLAALLKAFPGSRALEEDEAYSPALQDHYEPQKTIFGHKVEPQERAAAPSATEAVTGQGSADQSEGVEESLPAEAAAADDDGDDDSDDEQILIPRRTAGKASTQTQTMDTDSEEERQLDAIIAAQAGAQAAKAEEAASQNDSAEEGAGFTIDLTGSTPPPEIVDATEQDSAHPQNAFVLGERSFASAATPSSDNPAAAMPKAIAIDESFAAIIESSDDDDDDDGFVPIGRQRNKPKSGRKARNQAKKARRRAKKLGQSAGGLQDDEAGDILMGTGAQRRRPRTGDSDIEWGSDGPPDMDQPSNGSIDRNLFQMRDLNLGPTGRHADAPQTRAQEESMLLEALSISVQDEEPSRNGAGNTSFRSIAIDAPKSKKKGRQTRKQRQDEAVMQDYIDNALLNQGHESDDEDGGNDSNLDSKTDMDAMISFMNGMDPQVGGRQMTMGDIADEMQIAEEDEWMTESDEDGDSDSDEEAVFDAAEREVVNEGSSEDHVEIADETSGSDDSGEDDASNDGEDVDVRGDSDDSSSSDDDYLFDRNFTWADEDEAMLSKIDRFCAANDATIHGRDRKSRNRVFKAITSGDFDDFEVNDDDAAMAGLVPAKKKKGKKAAKSFAAGLGMDDEDDDHVWAEHLQSQWQKDRATKAANKRKRAAERQAAAQNPFPNTHKKGTKKMAKKAARAARRANIQVDPEGADAWDEPFIAGIGGGATDLNQVNSQIEQFLRLPGHSTLSLPPMDKRARARVHMLAGAYSLASKSRGSGSNRFTTLIKTGRSGVNVDSAKVGRVLRGTADVRLGIGKKGKGKASARGGGGSGGAGGGGAISVSRNIEGADVGWGADRIGADNIGHKLLSMMGWAEGTGMGVGGMAEPIGAKIKTSKGGLGF